MAAVAVAVATRPLPGADAFSDRLVIGLVALGVVLDVVRLGTGRPVPLAVGRQVPREWAALLPARATAVLYGARLGVGPLTILSTWTWWSVTGAAGLVSPLAGAAVGATFGGVRMLVMIVVSTGLRPDRHAEGYGRLRARTGHGWRTLTGLGALFVGATLLIGCASDDRPVLVTQDASDTRPEPSLAVRQVAPGPAATGAPDAIHGAKTGIGTAPGEQDPNNEEAVRPAIRPATLEDVVRTDFDPGAPGTTEDLDGPGEHSLPIETGAITLADIKPASDPGSGIAPTVDLRADLSAALIDAIDGYQAIDDPAANRFLDLHAASEVQPDPSEEIALLETRGFRGGWIRAFRNEENDVAVATVYEFDDEGEAEFYLEDGLITIGGYGGKFFDVDGMPGVRGFVQTDATGNDEPDAGPDKGPSQPRPLSLGAAFHHGSRWYLVYFVGSTATVGADDLLPVIEHQRALATAGPTG